MKHLQTKKSSKRKLSNTESTSQLTKIAKNPKQKHKKAKKTSLSAGDNAQKQSAQDIGTTSTDENIRADLNTEDVNSRTLFVGNVGMTVKKIHLQKLFQRYGKVQSVRLRGITPADPGMTKRLAAIKGTFHPKRTSFHSYIVFENREDALKATELNGTKFKEHFLRVQICDDGTELEPTKAIFIGNVPFDAEENDLWNTFEEYGKIISVRLVRNSMTGMCIGIGFVNFESSDAVELVLMTDSIKIKNRDVRIRRYANTKVKKLKQTKQQTKTEKKPKKLHKGVKGRPTDQPTHENNVFQGSKVNPLKKKKKRSKARFQNMKMIKKIAPR